MTLYHEASRGPWCQCTRWDRAGHTFRSALPVFAILDGESAVENTSLDHCERRLTRHGHPEALWWGKAEVESKMLVTPMLRAAWQEPQQTQLL